MLTVNFSGLFHADEPPASRSSNAGTVDLQPPPETTSVSAFTAKTKKCIWKATWLSEKQARKAHSCHDKNDMRMLFVIYFFHLKIFISSKKSDSPGLVAIVSHRISRFCMHWLLHSVDKSTHAWTACNFNAYDVLASGLHPVGLCQLKASYNDSISARDNPVFAAIVSSATPAFEIQRDVKCRLALTGFLAFGETGFLAFGETGISPLVKPISRLGETGFLRLW